MAVKLFTDTNILLDLFDALRPHAAAAQLLWQRVEDDEVEAFVSESVLTTIDYILQKSLSKQKRIAAYNHLLDFVTILPASESIFRKALQSNLTDLEDAVLYQLALEHELAFFITNDKGALKKLALPKVPVISAREFVAKAGK
jgi:predicted nucleic acid-binding protein